MPALAASTAPLSAGPFNVYPTATRGRGAYGEVPGQTGLPPSQYQQALMQVPGLAGNAAKASSDVQSLLEGQVSPDTQDYIQRLIAAKGVSTGVEGTPFNTADLVKSLGLTSEQLMTSGLGAYNQLLSTVGGLQENPALMSEVAQSNAMLGAAPDPQMATEQMLRNLQSFYGMTQDPAAGGFGSYHTLGPKLPGVSYPMGSPVGSPDNPWATNNQDAVQYGGPGYSEVTGPSGTTSSWQDYQNRTLGGYSLGNPGGGTGAGGGYFNLTAPFNAGSALQGYDDMGTNPLAPYMDTLGSDFTTY